MLGLTAAGAADPVQAASADRCHELVLQLRGTSRDERADGVTKLAALGPDASCATDALRAATHDPETFLVGIPALQALGRIGPAAIRAFPDVIGRWNDREVNPEDIETTLAAFGPRVIPRLIPYLDIRYYPDREYDPGVERIAIRVLATFGSQSVPALIKALRRVPSRATAAFSISLIGPPAASAVRPLIHAYEARDTNLQARGAILAALDALGDGACPARQFVERATNRLRDEREREHLTGETMLEKEARALLKRLAACPPDSSSR